VLHVVIDILDILLIGKFLEKFILSFVYFTRIRKRCEKACGAVDQRSDAAICLVSSGQKALSVYHYKTDGDYQSQPEFISPPSKSFLGRFFYV
jgi:hypothetical protein